jgi:hypothetical protein
MVEVLFMDLKENHQAVIYRARYNFHGFRKSSKDTSQLEQFKNGFI